MRAIVLINLININDTTTNFVKINGYTFKNNNLSTDLYSAEFPHVWSKIGTILKSSIIDRVHLFKIIDFIDEQSFYESIQPDFSGINTFFNFLWFVKDSCVSFKQAFGCVDESDFAFFFSNSTNFSKADGSVSIDTFSGDDITRAIEIHKAYSAIDNRTASFERKQYKLQNSTNISLVESTEYNDLNRIQRAFKFLNLARSNRELTLKISFYILLLECLFSADESHGLSYKVSKRIACYVTEDMGEQTKIFDLIKDCYDIRAKYVHGQQLKKKHDSYELLSPIAIELDELVRTVFNKVLTQNSIEFLLFEKDLNKWLDSLITSSQTPPSAAA